MSCNAHIRIAKFRLGLLAVGQVVCAVGCSLFLSQAGLAQVPSNDRLPVLTAPSRSRSPLESAEVQQYSQQYLLGTGDKVDVTVFNAPDYSGEFSVLAGGVLNLPLAGEIAVEGLSIQQASEAISAALSRYIHRPRTTVSLLSARPLQVAIAGQVNRPGAYTLPLEGENGSATPTLTQAIGLAGGITQSADIRNISVLRQSMSGDDDIEVNLWQLLREGQLSADLPLQRGDRILIPEADALTPEETTELASASFSPETITVNVVGEVETPGAIELPPNAPLNQAILSAGGFNRRANQNNIRLIRLNDNGSVTQQEVSADFASGVDSEANPLLRPNDTVVVGTNGLSRVTDTIGDILSPVNSGFGLLRLFGL